MVSIDDVLEGRDSKTGFNYDLVVMLADRQEEEALELDRFKYQDLVKMLEMENEILAGVKMSEGIVEHAIVMASILRSVMEKKASGLLKEAIGHGARLQVQVEHNGLVIG